MGEASVEEGIEVDFAGYDDRLMRIWPLAETPAWALETLGKDARGEPFKLAYVGFVPAHFITPQTPTSWWESVLRPAMLDCIVVSVDEAGACVLGLGSA